MSVSNLTTGPSNSIPNTTAQQDVPQPLVSCHTYSHTIFLNPFSYNQKMALKLDRKNIWAYFEAGKCKIKNIISFTLSLMSCIGMKFRYECARANTREGRKGGKCHCAKLSHRCASVLRGWQWICSSLSLWVYTLAWSVYTYRCCKAARIGKCRLPVIATIKCSFVSSPHFRTIIQSKFFGNYDISQETIKLCGHQLSDVGY